MALKITNGFPGNFDFKDCYQVDIDDWSFSDDKALYTGGANPCLTVVAHCEDKGGLAHVWNSDMSQKKLYEKACMVITAMIAEGIQKKSKIDLWLGAGTAFCDSQGGCNQDLMDSKFYNYIHDFLKLNGIQLSGSWDYLATLEYRAKGVMQVFGGNPGDILYFPKEGKIFLRNDNDQECQKKIFESQKNKSKAPLTWKCLGSQYDIL